MCPHINLTARELRRQPDLRSALPASPLASTRHRRCTNSTSTTSPFLTGCATAVIYQIFVDRFAPDPDRSFADETDLSGFFGGTLRGITTRLDYLRDLGVNCLWLTPIFPVAFASRL